MITASRKLAGLTGLALTAAWINVSPASGTASPSDAAARPGAGPAAAAAAPAAGLTPEIAGPAASTDTGSDGTPRRVVRVRGQQIPVDVANGRYSMRGDLIGDWRYIPRTPPLHASETLYVEAGTEVFNGCIDRNRNGRCGARDDRGELHLAFIYWASFDLDGGLLRGQCVHPVTGGSGAFAGARGVLHMVDRPVGDEVRTRYRGKIVLNAVPSEGAAAPVSTAADLGASTTASAEPMRRAC